MHPLFVGAQALPGSSAGAPWWRPDFPSPASFRPAASLVPIRQVSFRAEVHPLRVVLKSLQSQREQPFCFERLQCRRAPTFPAEQPRQPPSAFLTSQSSGRLTVDMAMPTYPAGVIIIRSYRPPSWLTGGGISNVMGRSIYCWQWCTNGLIMLSLRQPPGTGCLWENAASRPARSSARFPDNLSGLGPPPRLVCVGVSGPLFLSVVDVLLAALPLSNITLNA